MTRHVQLYNKKISYTLKKSQRARRMRIAVYCDGSVVVTLPHDQKEHIAERFIRDKSKWLFSKLAYFNSLPASPITRFSHTDFLRHKDEALQLVEKRVAHFNSTEKYRYNKINIKNQKTRWGSCSAKRNLNFNYKILFLPERLRDYVIVHELCHLKQFNHSQKFWNLVSSAFPDYQDLKSELRKSEMVLK